MRKRRPLAPSDPRAPSGMAHRTFERTQGCWNCVNFRQGEPAVAFWSRKRAGDLQTAHGLALLKEKGEKDPVIVGMRQMINTIDQGVAAGLLGLCGVGASETDLVQNTYLCDRWTAQAGASVARAGEGLDELPEEVRHEVDSAVPAHGPTQESTPPQSTEDLPQVDICSIAPTTKDTEEN